MKNKLSVLCTWITAASPLLLGVPVRAERPTIVLSPFTGGIAPTQDVCGFDIRVTPQVGRPNAQRLILFGQTAIVAGPLFNTLTNLSSGKAVNVNVSGPARLTFSETSTAVVGMGPGVLWSHALPADVAVAAGLPRVFLLHGRLVSSVDSQGNIAIESVTGTVQDLCQLLQ